MSYDWFAREICPCDNCEQAPQCKEYELACRAFSYYILHGTSKSYTVKHPTNHLFKKIFAEDDVALKRYMKSVIAKENYYQKQLFDEE